MRSIMGLTGVKNLISKSLGSTNKVNIAYAVIEGLKAQVPRSEWTGVKAGGVAKASTGKAVDKAEKPVKKASDKVEKAEAPKKAATKKATSKKEDK